MKKKLYIIAGILLILYVAAVNIKSATRIAFSGPVILLGAVMIIYGYKCDEILQYIDKITFLRKSAQLFKISLICLLCGLTIIEGMIICYPKHDTSDSQYILVLGAGLKDGYNPSATLRYRLNAAIDCVETYGNTGIIVVSGGQGADEKISEAEAMKKYLIDYGVPENRILVEDKSRTTDENFEYSR
uniref:YdcF family protein n=1 Tax=uncultured Clostridium sp. TaxID=59620 RepID=UPI0025F8263F